MLGANFWQSLAEHINCEFILHVRALSQCLQPIWIGDAVANRSYDVCRAWFLDNDTVPGVLDHTPAMLEQNHRQPVRLRFELRNRKSIRESRKDEYVSGSVLFSSLLSRCRAEPFHSRAVRYCRCTRDLGRANHPKFNRFIA